MSDTYCVIGIDPGLANVGLVVLDSPGPNRYEVSHYLVWTTDPKVALAARLLEIHREVRRFIGYYAPAEAVVIENPVAGHRSWQQTKTGPKAPRDVQAVNLATGVVFATACYVHPKVVLLDVAYWMPKVQSGNFTHTQRREQTMAQLRQLVAFPPLLKTHEEHVVMAAGVARRWIEDERLRRKREAQGIRV